MEPEKLRFAKTHEWANLEDDTCTVGLSQFAVEQLSEIMHIDLPAIDDPTIEGDPFGEIESVKAVSDVHFPVNGVIIAVNQKLENDPTIVSNDPYGQGWLIKIKVDNGSTLDHLMPWTDYQKQIASERH
jgi:glycine cleavage system H protein